MSETLQNYLYMQTNLNQQTNESSASDTGENKTIPHIIHYAWFGPKKPKLVLECIESWKKHLPEYEIKERNEHNVNLSQYPFADRMYKAKKFAFVSDYIRLVKLYEEGGVYLDTDMMIVKSITPLLKCNLLLGEEEDGVISAGMIGSVPHHPFIAQAKSYYEKDNAPLVTIPVALTRAFKDLDSKEGVTVLDKEYFYPFSQTEIRKFGKVKLGEKTYGVHMWNYSWGNPVLRFLNKYKFYKLGVKLLDKLKIKKMLKKLFRLV